MGQIAKMLVCFSVLCTLSGCNTITAGLSGLIKKPETIVLKDRTQTEWESVNSTKMLLDQGPFPTHWDAAFFIGTDALTRLGKRFEGLQAQYARNGSSLSGATVTVAQFDIKPSVGALEATIALTGKSPNLGLSLDLQVDAIARYEGTVTDTYKSRSLAKFKWVPISVRPSANWGRLTLAGSGFASSLLAQTAEYFARPESFIFTVPIQQEFSADAGLEQPQTETVKIKSTQGFISFVETMPAHQVKVGVTNTAAVFTNNGIWLVSELDQGNDSLPQSPAIPNVSVDQLQQQITAMRSSMGPILASVNPGNVDIRVFINSKTFKKLVAALGTIPSPSRTLSLQVASHQGKLAEVLLHDDVLGNIDSYAEIASDSDTNAQVNVGTITGGWTSNSLNLSAPISAHINSSIRFHVTPPITGGIGTTVGIVGDASQTISMSATPMLLTQEGVSVAALLTQAKCNQIPITATTDGVLKVDFGWMSVPSVGIKMSVPAFNNLVTPSSLLDSRPHFATVLPADTNDIHYYHKVPFWELVAIPTNLTSSEVGFQLDATIKILNLPQSATPDGLKSAQIAVQQEVDRVVAKTGAMLQANMGATICPVPDDPQLIVGKVKIGPTNDIVKFFKNGFNDIANGPSLSNDLVKAGYYVGTVFKRIDPGDSLIQGFLTDSRSAAKAAFGENSVAYSAVDHLDLEVTNVLANPAKATLDLPSNTLKSVQGFGNMLSDGAKALGNAGKKGVTVGNDNTNVSVGPGGIHGSIAGVRFGL